MVISKNVVFEEEKALDWDISNKEIRQNVLEWEDNNQSDEDVDERSPNGEISYH